MSRVYIYTGYRTAAIGWRSVVLMFMALLIGLWSCRQQPTAGRHAEPTPFRKNYSSGKVQLTYEVSRTAMRVADRLDLTLTVSTPESRAVQFPKPTEAVGKFLVADHHEEQPALQSDGRMQHRQHLTLEPALAGQYTIPPLTVTIGSKPGERPETIRTNEVHVNVESLLPPGRKDIDISDIAPPLAPPRQWLPIIFAGLSGMVLLGGAVWFLARRRGKTAEPPIPSHERALAELKKLLTADLPGKGEVKQFYAQISDILRRYIEERFGLRAPERTTEEFLAALGATDALIRKHRELLRRFLIHCDQVKFAGYLPAAGEIEATGGICREFILETAPAPNGVEA